MYMIYFFRFQANVIKDSCGRSRSNLVHFHCLVSNLSALFAHNWVMTVSNAADDIDAFFLMSNTTIASLTISVDNANWAPRSVNPQFCMSNAFTYMSSFRDSNRSATPSSLSSGLSFRVNRRNPCIKSGLGHLTLRECAQHSSCRFICCFLIKSARPCRPDAGLKQQPDKFTDLMLGLSRRTRHRAKHAVSPIRL